MPLFNKKFNFDNVTIRNMIIGLIDVFDKNLSYVTVKDGAETIKEIPFYYSQIGDERLLQDDFLLDTVTDPNNENAKTNYNSIPIGILTMNGLFAIRNSSLTNKHVRGSYLKEDTEGELKKFSAEMYQIPVSFSLDIEIKVENFLNLCKIAEAVITTFYEDVPYSYDVDGILHNALAKIPENLDSQVPVSFSFGDKREHIINFTVEVETFLVSFDSRTERFAGNLMQQGIDHNVIPRERNE